MDFIRCRDIEPDAQRRESFARLVRFLRRDVTPYSPWYRRVFAERGVRVEEIESEAAFRARVPFTYKEDLQKGGEDFVLQPRWPSAGTTSDTPRTDVVDEARLSGYRALAMASGEMGDVEPPATLEERAYREFLLDWQPILTTSTGGSTGLSAKVVYTYADLVGPFRRAGLFHHNIRSWRQEQRFMSLLPAGQHLGFYASFLIPLLHGQPIVPAFGGRVIPTEDQVLLAEQRAVQVVQGTTSYVANWLDVARALQETGKLGGLPSLEAVIVSGEPLTEKYARQITASLRALGARSARLLQGMSSTELKSGGFRECDEGTGLHVDPQHFYVEILDPATREPVPDGRPGALVWSHIDWHGTVLVRYWSGDVVEGGMRWGPCARCGLTLPRLFPPMRRLNADFVKVRGARVDVTALRAVLEEVLGRDGFQVVISSDDGAAARPRLVVSAASEAGVGEEAIRRVVMSVAELRVDRVEFCSRETLLGRLYASGWKPRWLVNQ